MAGYRLEITQRKLSLDPAQMYPRRKEILEAFAKVAEIEVKAKVWNHSMFAYDGLRPKPATSKSEKAWTGAASLDDLAITLSNDAVNRRGDHYAQYVHLKGRSKADKLWFKVREHVRDSVLPRMARALSHDLIKSRSVTTTRKVV